MTVVVRAWTKEGRMVQMMVVEKDWNLDRLRVASMALKKVVEKVSNLATVRAGSKGSKKGEKKGISLAESSVERSVVRWAVRMVEWKAVATVDS